MPQNDANFAVDIAIIGGGLAGLSLAAELAAPEFAHLQIVIVEPRAEYIRDRTWSYWRKNPHDYSDLESATWPAWRVQALNHQASNHQASNSSSQNSALIGAENAEQFVYASLNSDTFYAATLGKIKACSHITLLQNVSVESIAQSETGAVISLKNAQQITVKKTIFDSRPPKITDSNHLTQHFLGVELIADAPVFDMACVDLMDFQTAAHGIHFFYVLPYSSTSALIETTWFCDHHHHADYTQELNEYLAKKWPNTHFEIAYTENGSLPLMPQKAHGYWLAGVQVLPIGTPAGTARAATGYAFLETLNDIKRLANAIKNQQTLGVFKRNKIDAMMDKLFLSLLQKQQQLAPNLFVQMFSNCPPASLIRFLSGQANWADRIAVIKSMPATPMIKHLFKLNKI
jgi:lycopene beta-cyclase